MPFGSDQDEKGSEEFKYTGKRQDTTGLYFFGARYYDPDTGRFITNNYRRLSVTLKTRYSKASYL